MCIFFNARDEISSLFQISSRKRNKTSSRVLAACQSTLSDKELLNSSTKAVFIYTILVLKSQ